MWNIFSIVDSLILRTIDLNLFESEYPAARAQFLNAAQEAGADVQHHIHPTERAADGSPLAIDTARLGSMQANLWFVIFSGTHGLEGPTGSAVQCDYLRSNPQLPDNAAILFVHGVNPYGFAHFSRTNETNIDLNRNFVEHSDSAQPATDVEREIQQLFATDPVNFELLENLGAQVAPLLEKYGLEPVINAVTAGQYTFPAGLNFGGESASWSNLTLRGIIRAHCESAGKVVLLDWHTGLGEFGKPCYLCFNAPGSATYQHACNWWGEEAVAESSAFGSGGAQPQYSGLLVQGLAQELPQEAKSVQAVIEFGTYDNMTMVGALIVDRWLRFDSPKALSAENQQLKTWMIERFYPVEAQWREAVLNQALDIHQRTLQGLMNWTD